MPHATVIDLTGPGALLPAGHDPEQLAIATFLARYSNKRTRENYTIDLRDYMRFCRSQGVGMLAVERGHLELFIRQLEDRGLAQATIARRFGTVFCFLDYAEIDDRIPKNPARKVARPKVDKEAQRRTWFEIGEIHSIIGKARRRLRTSEERLAYVNRPDSQCEQRARDDARRQFRAARQDLALLQVLAETGIRVGALCSLDVESLRFDAGTAYLQYVRKGNKVTKTTLPTQTLLTLMAHLDGRATGPMFLGRVDARMTRAGVQRIITRLARSVGIDRKVTPHGLRRTFATTAARLGASHTEIQNALDQADPRTTDLYIRIDKGGSAARQKVAELLSA